jgi:hypothetical protein
MWGPYIKMRGVNVLHSFITRIFSLILIILTYCVLTGCESQNLVEEPKGLDMPVATVDGEAITVADLLEHPDIISITDELIFEKLLWKEAEEKGWEVTEEMVFETMQPYVGRAGGRQAFLDLQHEKGLTFDKIIYFGKLGLLQEMMVDDLVEEPTYDEVVEFLETDVGQLAYQIKAGELGKDPDEVTVEEVYDMALDRIREVRARELYEALREDILPAGHEVANLLKAAILDDPKGEAWIAAEPEPVTSPIEEHEPAEDITLEDINFGNETAEEIDDDGNNADG